MIGAYPHLLVNHLPILGTIFGILILGTGMFLRNDTVKQTGLGTLVFAALSSALALLTGDPAGDIVKTLPGISETVIEYHENMAYLSLWILIPSGILSAMAFYSTWKREKAAKYMVIAALESGIRSLVVNLRYLLLETIRNRNLSVTIDRILAKHISSQATVYTDKRTGYKPLHQNTI